MVEKNGFEYDELEFIFHYFRESLRLCYKGAGGVMNIEDQPDKDFMEDVDGSILDRARRVTVKARDMLDEMIAENPDYFMMKEEKKDEQEMV